jgi:hypothetical protein
MVKLFTCCLLLFISFNSLSQALTDDEKAHITSFIEAIKNKDFKKLMPFISFPIERVYPVPDIQNEIEFVYRYDEIFDDSITQIIVNSDVDIDWEKVGWRGIMLNSGDLWLDEYDWVIRRINVQSKVERERRKTLIAFDKSTIHESLKGFEEPIMLLKTKKHIIRIDALEDEIYRYAVWPIKSSMSEKPDLIINNGSLEYMGSGGNHEYQFHNGEYSYTCQINAMGTVETPPANLLIEKNGVEIMFEAAEIIHN